MLSKMDNVVQSETRFRRFFEIILEIAVGAFIVVGIYLWATKFSGSHFPGKWLGLGASSAIIFGYPIYWARAMHKGMKYWAYWLLFLILHVAVMVPIVAQAEQWPLVLYVFTTVGEVALIAPQLEKCAFYSAQSQKH